MKCGIEVIDGIKYFRGIDGDKLFEISDYIELHESSLVMIELIIDSKECYDLWGRNYVKYTKLWGCIDSMKNVVIPFIYQHMKRNFNYIEAEIEEDGICFSHYRHYYFNLYGVPIIYSTKKEMPGWDWIEDSDYSISIAQKDGKQGIVRNDGSVFIEPIYKKVEIDFSNPEITVTSDDNIRTSIVYRKDKKSWRFLPLGHRYLCFSYDLYVLVNKNNLEYAVDKQFNIVVPPYFDSIQVYPHYILVQKNGKSGILSRNKTIFINGLKDPVYAPIFKLEFDDAKIYGNRAIITINSLQGVIDLENGNILCSPAIPMEYQILLGTLNDNAIAFKTKQRQYGYFDLDGHLLFEIKIEDDKIDESSIRGFVNGKAHLKSNKYHYVFNRDGSYERIPIEQHYFSNTYHNYEAERWDALTDGMEGDYPGNGVDYDLFGFD